MSLLDRLDAIDRQRQALHAYGTRLRRLFFMKETRDRMLGRISQRWRTLSEERRQVMDLINADPGLKSRHQENMKAKSQQPLEAADSDLPRAAERLVATLDAERRVLTHYQQALRYYQGGDWKAHGLTDTAVIVLVNSLKDQVTLAIDTRASLQLAFETSVGRVRPRPFDNVLLRESLLADALKIHRARTQEDEGPNPLEVWHLERTGKILTRRVPEHEQLPPERRYRRRGRER